MNDETKKVCNALIGLIGKICTDHNTVPGGFSLEFGDDVIKITADINLKYDFTNESASREFIQEFIKKSESLENLERFIKDFENDKKE